MKKIVSIVLLLSVSVFCYATREEVVLHSNGPHPNHQMFPIPADMPDVYYDSSTQEIIIDGNGYATYYDVNIVSVATGLSVIFDTVSGYYGTVDVSSLPADDYTITITSSNNNVFEGSFCIEE